MPVTALLFCVHFKRSDISLTELETCGGENLTSLHTTCYAPTYACILTHAVFTLSDSVRRLWYFFKSEIAEETGI